MVDGDRAAAAPSSAAGTQGLLTLDVGTFLRALTLYQLARLRDQVDDELRTKVAQHRRDGATWDVIGDQIGTTRQAAQQRYGR